MKSSMKRNLKKVFGGLTNILKDWRIASLFALALFASASNFIKIMCTSHKYQELYIVFIWIFICILCLILEQRCFLTIIMFISISIALTDLYSYRSIGIFFLMIYVLTDNQIKRVVCFSSVIIMSMISYSIKGGNLIDIFAIIIQFIFASFCYYGFLYTSSRAFGNCPKLIYTDKEYRILYALATEDKTQKEIAYELGVSMAEIARTLASVREKNHFNTNDMMLRQFAVELYKTRNMEEVSHAYGT